MKKKLRTEALAKRNAISPEEREGKSSKAAAYLLQSEVFQNAKRVFTFVNMGTEISLYLTLDHSKIPVIEEVTEDTKEITEE